MTTWDNAQRLRESRKRAGAPYAQGKRVAKKDATALLEAVVQPGDRVCLEGDNQKQADLLAVALAAVNKEKIHDLHMVQSGVVLPEHLDLFELGIAKRLDYAYSGPQSQRIAKLLFGGKIELGAVHTYLELFARYYVDLTPQVALIAAVSADREGNLYTGPNTEDTPAIVEATAFKDGIVIAQVNEIVDKLPRVDIPGDWVDFVIESGKPFYVEPLFTRDPGAITETQILTAMLAIKGIYAPYGVQRLNHGIGFNTAAIELLLPTYGERLGLKGKIASHWALNPHPTLIPAIESGWVKQVHSFGSEVGMDDYIRARPDVFFTGPDGSLRSNRAFSQVAGLYACDMFIGSTLQIDLRATRQPSPPIVWRALAAHRTWAAMLAAGVIQASLGCRRGRKPIPVVPLLCVEAASWSCKSAKRLATRTFRYLWKTWTRSNSRQNSISISHRSWSMATT
jgi:malonate decarboxylase alpha subunit